MAAFPTTVQGWQSRASREVTISESDYVSGVLALGWPDGKWPIKLPNAEIATVEVRHGVTVDLAAFVWNALGPGARTTVQPPRGHSPGVLALAGRTAPAAEPPQAQIVISRDAADDPVETSLGTIRQAVDRLEPPVVFERVWAFLSDGGVDMSPASLIELLRRLFYLDDAGFVRTHDDIRVDGPDFRPIDCQWDNVEQAYWELHSFDEPPPLEPMYRKRKKSIYDGLEYHLDEMRHSLLRAPDEKELGGLIHRGQQAAEELRNGGADFHRKVELGLAIRAADEARERFQEHNLRLVLNIAAKYRGQLTSTSLDFHDLIQSGYVGLLTAVEKFDPEKGFKFSTYATWWIRQSITRHIADRLHTIRIPAHLHNQLQDFELYRERLLTKLGRPPSTEELVAASGLSAAEINAVSQIADAAPMTTEDELVPDSRSDDALAEQAIEKEERAVVVSTVAKLDDRTARLLTLRFGLDGQGKRTLEEVGRELKVTRERVRQLESKGLATLRADRQIQRLSPEQQGASPESEELPVESPEDQGQEGSSEVKGPEGPSLE